MAVRSSIVKARSKPQPIAPSAPRTPIPPRPPASVAPPPPSVPAPAVLKSEPAPEPPRHVISPPLPFAAATPEPIPSPLAPTVPLDLNMLLAAPAEELAVEEAEVEVEVSEPSIPIGRRVMGTLGTMSEIIDPRILQKMLPATRERRRHLAKYVKGVVAVCAAVCVLAGVSAAIGASGGEAKAALTRVPSVAALERNGITRSELVRASLPEVKEIADRVVKPKGKRR